MENDTAIYNRVLNYFDPAIAILFNIATIVTVIIILLICWHSLILHSPQYSVSMCKKYCYWLLIWQPFYLIFLFMCHYLKSLIQGNVSNYQHRFIITTYALENETALEYCFRKVLYFDFKFIRSIFHCRYYLWYTLSVLLFSFLIVFFFRIKNKVIGLSLYSYIIFSFFGMNIFYCSNMRNPYLFVWANFLDLFPCEWFMLSVAYIYIMCSLISLFALFHKIETEMLKNEYEVNKENQK